MLRGLVIRQIFFAADLLLMCLIGAAAIFTILRLLDSSAVTVDTTGATAAGSEQFELPVLGDKAEYEKIAATRLFGNAGQTKKEVAAEPEPPKIIDAGNLGLTLLGCSYTTPTDPRSSAIIEARAARDGREKISTYFVNQEITTQVTLAEVHKGYVLLQVGPNLQRLELKRRDGTPINPAPKVNGAANLPVVPDPPGVKTLDRAELMEELVAASGELASMAPRLAYDDDQNVIGVTADGLNDLPLAQKLGFQDGDVVQNINGEAIDSLDKVTEVLNKFQDIDTIRIGVQRGGKAQMMTFKMK